MCRVAAGSFGSSNDVRTSKITYNTFSLRIKLLSPFSIVVNVLKGSLRNLKEVAISLILLQAVNCFKLT